MPPKVKICGVTRLSDAELAVELGAWAVGLIFYEGSPRRCGAEEAERISAALRRRVKLTGVFVNAPLGRVVDAADRCRLSLLQLHGDEGPSFCQEAARRTGCEVIKATRVRSRADLQALGAFATDFHLLDAHQPGLRGGTGETFDWGLVSARRSKVPLVLSGGLHADNVPAAIAATHPFAVDTASGTEAAPGRKDPAKLEAFFAAVSRAETASGSEPAHPPLIDSAETVPGAPAVTTAGHPARP